MNRERPTVKPGDQISLQAVVDEVRADGLVILHIPASTSLIKSVVVSRLELLATASPSLPNASPAAFAAGAHVRSTRGELGRVMIGDQTVYRIKRLADRGDAVMVQWEGRGLPTWEAPEDVVPVS